MKKEIVLKAAQQCEHTQVTVHFKMVNFIFVYYHSGKKKKTCLIIKAVCEILHKEEN